MGIEGLFGTLNKKGLAPTPVDLSQFQDTRIEIDFLGSYYGRILTLMTDDNGPNKASEVGKKLVTLLAADFIPTNRRIHIDGDQSAKKHEENETRLARRKRPSEQLDKDLEKKKTNSLKDKWTAHSVMTRIDKGLRQTFQLTATDKDILQSLRAQPLRGVSMSCKGGYLHSQDFEGCVTSPLKYVHRAVYNLTGNIGSCIRCFGVSTFSRGHRVIWTSPRWWTSITLISEARGEDIDPSRFDTAKSVFIELHEDILEEKDSDNYFTKEYTKIGENKDLHF
ncbi:hypothetical protein BGZ65_005593 [Modicella reniformis]|uniref:Uncharacterized protein n=1 Tax=Modicella reniformis TaxID=1440133 RepID=A0A9P6IXN3_9FUNG|nr:hypothetical protein BGZ65_005593 [Modicella reniformis]